MIVNSCRVIYNCLLVIHSLLLHMHMSDPFCCQSKSNTVTVKGETSWSSKVCMLSIAGEKNWQKCLQKLWQPYLLGHKSTFHYLTTAVQVPPLFLHLELINFSTPYYSPLFSTLTYFILLLYYGLTTQLFKKKYLA